MLIKDLLNFTSEVNFFFLFLIYEEDLTLFMQVSV